MSATGTNALTVEYTRVEDIPRYAGTLMRTTLRDRIRWSLLGRGFILDCNN